MSVGMDGYLSLYLSICLYLHTKLTSSLKGESQGYIFILAFESVTQMHSLIRQATRRTSNQESPGLVSIHAFRDISINPHDAHHSFFLTLVTFIFFTIFIVTAVMEEIDIKTKQITCSVLRVKVN